LNLLSGNISLKIFNIHLRIEICKEFEIQYLSISAAVTQDDVINIFQFLCKFSIILKSSFLFVPEIFLLSSNIQISFLESFFIGQTSPI
jgi:hypothetical protein